MMDTGDWIEHKPTRDRLLVACVHGNHLYPMGYPERTVRVADCELLAAASEDYRRGMIEALAASSGDGHRPRCARERLAQENKA